MDVMDATTIYAAIVSTVVLLWDLWKYADERARLSLHCYIAVQMLRFVPVGGEYSVEVEGEDTSQIVEVNGKDAPPFVACKVTNVGGKPIIVAGVGGTLRGGKTFKIHFPNVAYPRKLEPGEFFETAASLSIVGSKLASIVARDSTGGAWKLGWWKLRRLKKAARSAALAP